jgi:hypothetical protein
MQIFPFLALITDFVAIMRAYCTLLIAIGRGEMRAEQNGDNGWQGRGEER